MSDIKPALSAEEWQLAKLWDAGKLIGGETPPGYGMYNPRARPEKKHGLAAVCLHGQPFGFTWEMVQAIRDCAEFTGGHEAEVAEAAAKRIERLLPPREGDGKP